MITGNHESDTDGEFRGTCGLSRHYRNFERPRLCVPGMLGMDTDNITLGILAGGKSSRMGRDKALLLWNGRTLIEHVREQFADCGRVLVSVGYGSDAEVHCSSDAEGRRRNGDMLCPSEADECRRNGEMPCPIPNPSETDKNQRNGEMPCPSKAGECQSRGSMLSPATADECQRRSPVPYPTVADERQGYGPLEGIYRLLLGAQTDWVFVVAADLPLVNAELLACLWRQLALSGANRAQGGGQEPFAVIPCAQNRVHPLCGLYHRRAIPSLQALFAGGEHRVRALLDQIPVVYVQAEECGIDPHMFLNVNTPEDFRKLKKEQECEIDLHIFTNVNENTPEDFRKLKKAQESGRQHEPGNERYLQSTGRPYVFAVCGVKNSGKTTYLEKLVAALKACDIRIGVVKHDGHDFDADVPGTDSSRMYRAGADAAAVFSEGHMLFHERGRRTLDDVLSLFAGYDLVLVEGAKASSLPKIELVRSGVSSAAVSCAEGRIGVATNIRGFGAADGSPVYPLDDVQPLAEELLRRIEAN